MTQSHAKVGSFSHQIFAGYAMWLKTTQTGVDIKQLSISESVELLGFWLEIKAYENNTHSHMLDIGIFVYLGALFFGKSEEFGWVDADSKRAFSDSLLGVV